MKLEYLMAYRAELKPVVDVGPGPLGVRNIYDVLGGTLEGPRLRGKLLPSGGDWLLTGPDGVGRLDVRATFETDDGAYIYMQYFGIVVVAGAAAEKLARGEGTDYGDAYFMTSPRFETGDPRYAWLNAVVAVAEGRFGPGWVEYRVYQAVNG
ncbi:MAG: DUF3237 domain-containing protein [Dehalococcoidia bacterium]|nr:DUF3237 domain-containing protein [Chloroflexi bacterium CFX7]MCK6565378.1 DUF3237 domain-containing protein [Dehalococcoidia bacterium]NUQ56283.1 DUF3237 domain-containing protein [Dehalococcoidia bacterium]